MLCSVVHPVARLQVLLTRGVASRRWRAWWQMAALVGLGALMTVVPAVASATSVVLLGPEALVQRAHVVWRVRVGPSVDQVNAEGRLVRHTVLHVLERLRDVRAHARTSSLSEAILYQVLKADGQPVGGTVFQPGEEAVFLGEYHRQMVVAFGLGRGRMPLTGEDRGAAVLARVRAWVAAADQGKAGAAGVTATIQGNVPASAPAGALRAERSEGEAKTGGGGNQRRSQAVRRVRRRPAAVVVKPSSTSDAHEAPRSSKRGQ